MRPLFSRLTLLRIGLLFGAWTAYGVFCGWQEHYWYALTGKPVSWADALRRELTYACAWWLCTPLILWTARRFRFERRRWKWNLPVHAAAMTLAVALTRLAGDPIVYSAVTGALLYSLVVLIEHAIIYYRRYQAGLVRAAQLQAQLSQARLHALKMQLHPHFLFNTLHTIAALVHDDPDMAERTIARLGELLRSFLADSTIHEVPLCEELRILDLYLEIERARFEERLQVRYRVPEPLRNATVPSLVLQPLLENSIRHGIGKRARPGWISVVAESYEDTLVLRVADNGEGLNDNPVKPVHQGMGLAITRGRLESLYGPRQSLVLRNLPAGGVEARITLPLRTTARKNYETDHVELQSIDR